MAEEGIIIIYKIKIKKKIRRISKGDFWELSEGICPHSTPLNPPFNPTRLEKAQDYFFPGFSGNLSLRVFLVIIAILTTQKYKKLLVSYYNFQQKHLFNSLLSLNIVFIGKKKKKKKQPLQDT
jgi:hypothetical protein